MIFPRIKPAELISPSRRELCIERLRQTVGSPWSLAPGTGIVGRIREDAITLRCKIWYRNSFQTILRGRLSDDPQGTRISCRFGMNRFVFVFMCVWFASLASIGGPMFVGSLIALVQGGNWGRLPPLPGVSIPILMLCFGAALLKFGWYLARNERDEMLQFLRGTLSARDADMPSPGPVRD
jgi:hypothetical protein